MRAVNLASKPFVNRRPVIRVAGLVWVLAIGLAAVNVWRYGDFFRTATSHRSRLADLETAIAGEQQRNGALREKIGALKLDEENSTANYLNGLIHQRVFPWSRLFDDIEDVLPKDVYLTGLSPQIQKVEKVQIRTSSRASRARTGRTPQPRRPPKVVPEKDIDRVAMTIAGYSRSDEAMLDLVDRLYASPTFLDPVLAGEKRDPQTGLVSFSISVIYLTRAKLAEPVAVGALAQAGAESGGAEGGGLEGTLAEGVVAGESGDGAVPGSLAGREAAGREAAGREAGPGGLYGQPGFAAPGAAPSAGDGSRPVTRPGFDAGTGGAAPDARGAGDRRSGAGQRGDSTILQPGFSNPDLRQPGAAPGEVVVPPRRPPGRLLPSVSATPGLRGGG